MNAIDMLKGDHRKVKKLFGQFESAAKGNHGRKEKIAGKSFDEIEVHSEIEQDIFYPAVQKIGEPQSTHMVEEALEEHRLVKGLIDELKSMAADEEQYDARYKVLCENVRHHIQEEEGQMFPYAQRQLTTVELNDLGDDMAQRKEELTGPSLLGKAVRQARDLAVAALETVTGPSSTPARTSTTARRSRRRTTQRTGRAKSRRKTAARSTGATKQSRRTRRAGRSQNVRRAAAKTIRSVAKRKRARKTNRRTGSRARTTTANARARRRR